MVNCEVNPIGSYDTSKKVPNTNPPPTQVPARPLEASTDPRVAQEDEKGLVKVPYELLDGKMLVMTEIHDELRGKLAIEEKVSSD